MKYLFQCCVLAALTLAANAQTASSTKPTDDNAPTYSKALGIGLEEIDYPFPVRFLELNSKGQRTRMAYMDVPALAPKPIPVLLLHGKNFGGYYWASTIRALTAQGYRVIVPDQIGFGKSSKPDIKYSFDGFVDNTATLLDELKIPKVIVVGHSMGGMLGVKFARELPNRVTKLVLENPIGLEDYRAAIGEVPFEKWLDAELSDTDSSTIRAFFRRYFVLWKPEYEKLVEPKSRVALSGEFPRWANAAARTYEPIWNQPIVDDLPLLKLPTLLVIGQSDRTVVGRAFGEPEIVKGLGFYPALGKKAAKVIPGARLLELESVGHIPHLEVAGEFERALLEFIR